MAQPLSSGISSQGAATQKLEAERGLAAALIASEPAPELGTNADLFGRLVGNWEVDLISHRTDPILPKYVECEWHFGWVLGGRAIQDVWIAPKRALRHKIRSAGEWGTMIRFYDQSINAWRCTWHGPSRGMVLLFLARAIDDQIVLEGVFDDQGALRWIFSEITNDSFQWRSVVSSDNWKTENLIQEMFARRQVGYADKT